MRQKVFLTFTAIIILNFPGVHTLFAETSIPPVNAFNLQEFNQELTLLLDNRESDMEKLDLLYTLLEELRSQRISYPAESYYTSGRGDRPSPSTMDRNLRYTLFIEEVYQRIDSLKSSAARELAAALHPLSGMTQEIRIQAAAMADLNSRMGQAVSTARDSFEEMIQIRNDYLEVLELQKEVMRLSLRARGPRTVLLTGLGFISSAEGESVLTGEAGFLYNFGPLGIGITGRAGASLESFGASVFASFNIQ